MSSIVISPAAGGSVTYADTGSLDTPGQFWLLKSFQPRDHEIEKVVASGEDDCGSKDHGARTEPLCFDVMYVGNTDDQCSLTMKSDFDLMAAGMSDIVMGGITFKRCKLDGASKTGQPRPTGFSTWCAVMNLAFESWGT